jgi:hypothetical protein
MPASRRSAPWVFLAVVAAATTAAAAVAAPLALAVAGAKPEVRLGSAPVLSRGARPAEVRLGSPPELPRGARPLASLASVAPMHITIVLKPRDPAALAAYAEAVSTPGSPVYRRYIKPAQFARRFGPSRATAAAVAASLRAHGLRPGRRSANGLSFTVVAGAGLVERAFALSFASFALPGGHTAVLNTLAPAVDAPIAGALQGVLGLSSLAGMHPLRVASTQVPGARLAATHLATALLPTTRRASAPLPTAHAVAAQLATGGPQPCAAASLAAKAQSAYTSDQIASAYNFSGLYAQGDEGQGETVAVYELEPYDPADIEAYEQCYGIDTSITPVGVDGGAGSPGPGSGEAALDIEQLIAFAPRARVLVYEGPNASSNGPGSGPYDVFSEIISQDRAQILTNSWGNCEPDEGSQDAAAENVLFEEAAAQGQTVLSAAGDDGSEDCYGYNPGSLAESELSVDDPASQPFVTGVGGSSLQALGPPLTETVWNDGIDGGGATGIQPGAGGGGISAFWGMPAYQADAPAALNVIERFSSASPCHADAGYCREIPDVSADADPDFGYLIFYNGSGQASGAPTGWQGTGGTSGAAPLWAALFALADGAPACHGLPVGFVNPALYGAAAGTGKGTYFHDVTSGDNDFTQLGDGRYPAGVGYDMASGVGSPDAAALAGELCGQALRLADPGPQRAIVGSAAGLQLSAGDTLGAAIKFTATNLPPGLTLNSSTGRIAGAPRAVGRFGVTVQASDAAGSVRVASFVWTVAGRPTVSAASLTSVAAGRPQLALTVAAGHYEAAISAISIVAPRGLWFAQRPGVWKTGGGGGSPRYTYAVVAGALQLRLRSAAAHLAVRFAYTLLRARVALIRSVSRHERASLKFIVTVTDASRLVSTLPVALRPAS